jgi:hypothetical protein
MVVVARESLEPPMRKQGKRHPDLSPDQEKNGKSSLESERYSILYSWDFSLKGAVFGRFRRYSI